MRSPAARASAAVKPPGLVTSRSAPPISSGMLSVQPKQWRSMASLPRKASSRRPLAADAVNVNFTLDPRGLALKVRLDSQDGRVEPALPPPQRSNFRRADFRRNDQAGSKLLDPPEDLRASAPEEPVGRGHAMKLLFPPLEQPAPHPGGIREHPPGKADVERQTPGPHQLQRIH